MRNECMFEASWVEAVVGVHAAGSLAHGDQSPCRARSRNFQKGGGVGGCTIAIFSAAPSRHRKTD